MHLDFLNRVAFVIDMLALAIILVGLGIATVQFLRSQIVALRGEPFGEALMRVRCSFGAYLLLGLEFMIAADITRTINEPSYEELIVLGSIVVIRTLISHFLNKEIQDTQRA